MCTNLSGDLFSEKQEACVQKIHLRIYILGKTQTKRKLRALLCMNGCMEHDYTISIDEKKISLRIVGPIFESQVGIFKSNCRGILIWEVVSVCDVNVIGVFSVESNLKVIEEVNVAGKWVPNPNTNKKEISDRSLHNNRGMFDDTFIIRRFENHLIKNHSFSKKKLKKPIIEFKDFLRAELPEFLLKNEVRHMILEIGRQKLNNCLNELIMEKIHES